MSTVQPKGSCGRRWLIRGAIAGAVALAGCAVVYPELSTPVRTAPADGALSPEPPSDLVQLAISGARIPRKTRDGRTWDKGAGSAPDVYAILFIDRVEVARTEIVPNTFEAEWPDAVPVNYRILPTTEVSVELWDDNMLVAHPICSEVLEDVTRFTGVGSMEVSCDSGAQMQLQVLPAKPQIGMGLYYEKRGNQAFVTRVIAASSAGRTGVRPGDEIISVRGRLVTTMTAGELESIMNANARGGLAFEMRGKDGVTRKLELREEAMYTAHGEAKAP